MDIKRAPLSPVAWALIGLSALIMLWAGWLCGIALHFPGDGTQGYLSARGFDVYQVPPDSPLQADDVIVQINGRAVGAGLGEPGAWHAFLFADAPTSATYTVLRDGQSLDIVVPWHAADGLSLLARVAPFWLVAGSFLAATWLIVMSRARDNATYLLALTLCIEGGNILFNMLPNLGANLALSLTWLYNPLDMLSFALVMSMAFHVLTIFPERKRIVQRWPWLPYALHTLNVIFVAIAVSGVPGRTLLETRAWMFGRILYPLAAVEMVAASGMLIHTYLTTRAPGVRNQIRWLTWGVALGPLPWLLLYNLPIALTGEPLAPISVVNIPLMLIPLSLTFSVTRRGLMAVDTLINQSLVYSGMTGALLAVYFLVVGGVDWLLRAWMGERGARLAPLVAIVVIAWVANPLRERLQRGVDRIFYRRWLDLKSLMREVSERLSTTLQVDAMAKILVEELPHRLHVTQAALLLKAEDGAFRAANVALAIEPDAPIARYFEARDVPLVLSAARHPRLNGTIARFAEEGWELVLPLRTGRHLMGLYLLGPRVSGDLYGQDELETLTFLGRQIGVTLENARLYQQVAHYTEDLEALVSERTHALEQANLDLGHERDRLNVIIQNMADGLMVTSPEGRVALVNPAMAAMVKCSQMALHDLPLHEAVDCPQLVTLTERALAEPGPVLSTDCHLNQRVLRALSTALQDGSGVITVMRDITHEAEVDRMKTEFISTVSHELRTPLTSVLGFTKLIAKSLDRDVAPALTAAQSRAARALKRTRNNLDIIITEGERLTRLINDVLDIAKMESGKMEWHDRACDLTMLIHQAVQSAQSIAADKPLTIEAQLESDLPQLVADPDRIHQLLLNLISNAVKFTDTGSVTITARRVSPQSMTQRWIYPQDNAGGILIAVQDTGVGIPQEEISGLFRRFKQVHTDTLTDKPKGTGLGLAISREVVTHYGGIIWVESEAGVGSTFKFVLPLPEAASEAETSPPVASFPMLSQIRERVQDSMPDAPDASTMVLVVDDEPNIRSLLNQELTEAGYHVIEAAHGAEALTLARRHLPAVILLDVMMPNLSGFDVTKILKSDPTTAHIPIMILSIIEDREHGLALGADAYLNKPIETQTVLDTVSSLISQVPQRPKAMVAGEDRTALEGITRLLREQGFDVVEAYDPRGAISTALQVKPDLVVLDEMLSKLNDAEVIKALRFQERERAYTIIVLAGSGQALEDADAETI